MRWSWKKLSFRLLRGQAAGAPTFSPPESSSSSRNLRLNTLAAMLGGPAFSDLAAERLEPASPVDWLFQWRLFVWN